MNQQIVSQANKVILILVAAIGLYLVSLANYLLFHSLAELFSVMIGTTTFVITWNAREYTKDQFDFLAFISVAYLFVALLDVLHTLSYTGMNVFTDYNFHANQVWVAARFLESLSLLTGFLLLKKRLKINLVLVFLIYSGITLAISLAIFFSYFPGLLYRRAGPDDFQNCQRIPDCRDFTGQYDPAEPVTPGIRPNGHLELEWILAGSNWLRALLHPLSEQL